MQSEVSNLLYRHPELYEVVYADAGNAVPRLVEAILHTQLGRRPESLLDLGCGTGRDLDHFAKQILDTAGVDNRPATVAYARDRRPTLDLHVGDLREVRLGRTFEAITCLGHVLANVHTNHDVARAMATFAAHSAPGTLLVLEVIDPLRTGKLPRNFTIDIPDLRAEAIAEYTFHPAQQLLDRERVWRRAKGPVRDHATFRLLYPKELEYYLDNHGFEIVACHDLPEKHTAASAFVVARYRETGDSDSGMA